MIFGPKIKPFELEDEAIVILLKESRNYPQIRAIVLEIIKKGVGVRARNEMGFHESCGGKEEALRSIFDKEKKRWVGKFSFYLTENEKEELLNSISPQ